MAHDIIMATTRVHDFIRTAFLRLPPTYDFIMGIIRVERIRHKNMISGHDIIMAAIRP